jgi:tetratricopeptide (TPR) repeat protein
MSTGRRQHLLIIFLVIIFSSARSQSRAVHISVQGTWDKSKSKERAQFGADNKLLNNYFGTLKMDLIRISAESNGVGSIKFKVTDVGAVDSVVFVQKLGNAWDLIFYNVINSTSGKWLPARVNGVKKDETITIWYNVFNGRPLRKLLDEYLKDATEFFNKGEFEKALKNIDAVLQYDALHAEALILKAETLASLNRKNEACEFMKSVLKYDRDDLRQAAKKICD